MRTTHTSAGIFNSRRHRLLLGAIALAILGFAGLMYLLFGLPQSAFGAFLGDSGNITIDGAFSDWGTTGSPAEGVATSKDESNDGAQDANSRSPAQDIARFWMGVETVSGGTTAPTTGNEVQAFYFRFDTLDGDLTLATKYNIQLNLGVAAAGKADHLLLMIADSDTSTPPVRIVLYQYNNFPEVGALATGDLAAKVANVSGFGVEDTAATGAIGKYDTTNTLHGFEIKIPVDWFGATYGGNFTNVGTGASSVVTAVFTGTGNSLGSVGTIKDTLNNTSGVTTGTNTDTETGDTSFVELEVNKLVITTSAQTLTAGTASAEYTVQTQNDLGARAIVAATGNTNIKMSSDSATGTFSATAGGTYTTTLTQTINVGANSTTFFYKDIVSGSHIITAAEDPAESPDWTNAVTSRQVV